MAKNLLYIQQLLHILTCFLNCLGGKLSFVYGFVLSFYQCKEVLIIITFVISVSIQ